MSYVSDPAVEWDVFLSYAHVDNAEGWVDRFHKRLSVTLDQLVGRAGELRIWRDPNIDETHLFDDVIRNRLQRSAIFLALCSRGHHRSRYCALEFETFRSHFGDSALRVGERTRVVRVRLQNVPYEDLPAVLGPTGSFDFFATEGPDDVGTPFDTDSVEFRGKLGKLANGLFRVLEELRQKGEEKAAPDPEPAPGGFDVFVAEVCDTQRVAKRRLTADLEAQGVKVAPAIPPPHAAMEHERSVRAALAQCTLSVHLFDAWGDNPIEGRGNTTYSREQLRLAREEKVRGLIWIPQRVPLSGAPRESLEDAQQLDFLRELEARKRDEDQYRIVRCPANELPALIAGRVKELRAPAPESSSLPAVLLDTHLKDQQVAFDVGRALLERHVQPYLNPATDDPRQNTVVLAERLKQVQGLIILYGQASEEWVRNRLIEVFKLVVSSRSTLRACGILLAPPDCGQDRTIFDFPLFKPVIMDSRKGLTPQSIEPILQGLGVA